MRWRWLWGLFPISVGLVLAFIIFITDEANPIIYAQSDLGTLIIIIGIAISILTASIIAISEWAEKIQIETIIHSAEDRRRFLRRLDHELKNPLTAILAGLANLSIAENFDDKTSALNSVQTQVSRLRRLVTELRKLSDLEIRPLDQSPIDLTELLEDAFNLAQDHSEAGDRILNLSIPRAPWPLPTINGDRDLLILAIHNLLDNAIKFSQSNDTIEMRAFEDGTSIVIEIADTGPGIPSSDQDHVWEELYRGEQARGIPGSGLGLALVRAIVARHNGNISLRSRPGKGTVFTMRLPGQ
jgi:two-component system OmpR family sensor kinase